MELNQWERVKTLPKVVHGFSSGYSSLGPHGILAVSVDLSIMAHGNRRILLC